MTPPELIVYKGEKSQTGLAFKKEFPGIPFDNTELRFENIRDFMKGRPLKAVLPIWNSHEGEVILSYALSMLFDDVARLYYLWPKKIEFACFSKKANGSQGKKLISVKVAKAQCSKFIYEHNYEFFPTNSTTDAYKEFEENDDYVAVLCAPEINEGGFDVLCPDAANPINFTTFALLGSPHSVNWGSDEWNPFASEFSRFFTALQMPNAEVLSDSLEGMFDRLIDDAEHIDDVPKVIFVAKHADSECRVILESRDEFAPPVIFDDDNADDEITIIPDVGRTNEIYSDRINLFLRHYPKLSAKDFVRHQGTKACFYACPVLGIVTHGFDPTVTEFIVRQIIKRYFELFERGADASEEQLEFYNKYVEEYRESGIDFINFENVGLDTPPQ